MAFCLSKNYSYLCYMGNWEKQQDEKKESRERDQSRRENLGKFFYDLAKLTFAGLVIGGIATFDTELKESIFLNKVYYGYAKFSFHDQCYCWRWIPRMAIYQAW